MKVVQLESESIKDLRQKRRSIMKKMIEGQEGSLLVLRTSFLGEDRRHHSNSFAVFSIFFDLWDRFTIESWSYTFDDEGLIFYIKMEEDARKVKDVLIHFEDYHPLGFAIDSDVFDKDRCIRREDFDKEERLDFYFKKPLEEMLSEIIFDENYMHTYAEKIEDFMLSGDKQTILSNVLVYACVAAFTKTKGFGMYGPNYRGSNDQMNFEKFVHLLRTYREEMLHIFEINPRDPEAIYRFQEEVDRKIKLAVLNQQSYYYTVYMTSIVMFAFINSRGFADMPKQIEWLSKELQAYGAFEKKGKCDVERRYAIALKGFRPVFKDYLPFYQKHESIIATFLYILSRHDDYAVECFNGEKTLLKAQFLAKNLVLKEDKWETMNQFCTSNYLYPHDSTILLGITVMLDVLQRNYLKIKILFDTNHY